MAAFMVTAAPIAAQRTSYSRGPDTLRLREVTHSEITVSTPQGELSLTALHDAVIAVTFVSADTARAWYEKLLLAFHLPDGRRRADVTAILDSPYVLTFDQRGRITTLIAPEIPADIEQLTDLSRQFDDFFPRLPASPLAVGLAWSDTVTLADSTADGRYSRSHHIAAYLVERDTVIRGEAAVLVRMRQTIMVESGGPVAGQPLTFTSQLAGTDDGTFVFITGAGRLDARRRTGDLQGAITYHGGPAPVKLNQRYRYTNEIAAMP